MGLGVEDVVIQADEVGLRKDEIKVLERLGDPEALSRIVSWVPPLRSGSAVLRVPGMYSARTSIESVFSVRPVVWTSAMEEWASAVSVAFRMD